MKSRWVDADAAQAAGDPLELRAYTSRLIGSDADLVLHGGGNTSVKAASTDLFGRREEILYIKGSGWDLRTIAPAGFAPVRLEVLKRMAELDRLSDTDMVKYQRAAMLDPSAPNPSVEAILHAIIPLRFVDHTHADAVITVSNMSDGEARLRDLYGDRVLIVPYVMPGFVLARKVAGMTGGLDWSRLDGMVLMSHGLFSFDDEARSSYEKTIELVDRAERYIDRHGSLATARAPCRKGLDPHTLCRARKAVSTAAGRPMIAALDESPGASGFSSLDDVGDIATRGPLTPDHAIRTKRVPMIVDGDVDRAVEAYVADYVDYFQRNTDGELTCLDPAPRWAVWPGHGVLAFGPSVADAAIVGDITRHTVRCIQWGESLGGWRALPEKDIFAIEYWELEQAKLKKSGARPAFQGRVALVTGAASGIGKACVESLLKRGAAVIALDVDPGVEELWKRRDVHGGVCDVRDGTALLGAVDAGVRAYGGLDIVISNAGIFPPSERIAEMDERHWSASLELNLSSHQRLLKISIPYLREGVDPAVVIVGSKNVAAPGPGASAYSAAKAGLNQLARVAALELAADGIRVNTVHPNAVFDTGIWTDDVLRDRARHYGVSVQDYRKSNLLRAEVTSHHVAELICEMAGPLFSRTTGAQVPIDGGNDRVI